MNFENKKGIKMVLDRLKKLQRYEQNWGQLDESKNGSWILYDFVESIILNLLKEEEK